jgi:PAS domain-containing protein
MKADKRKKTAGFPAGDHCCALLFQRLPYGVVLFDSTLAVEAANPAAMRMLGLSGNHFERKVGSPEWHFTDADGRRLPFHALPLSRAFSTGKPVRNYTVGMVHPKTKRTIWLRGDVLPEKAGRQLRYWSVFHDVTREFELEAALRQHASARDKI